MCEMSTLELTLPIRLPAEASVTAFLRNTPDSALHGALTGLGFWRSGYPDERLGRIGQLDAALRRAEDAGNPFWRMATVGRHSGADVVGDLLIHARVYRPDAVAATLVGGAGLTSGTAVRRLGAEWVAWAPLTLRVE